MQPSRDVTNQIKHTSPRELSKRGNIIYESKRLDEYLTLAELRQILYMLAESGLLSAKYISQNAAGNAPDAIRELYGAVSLGVFIESDPNVSTMKMYYRVNPDIDPEILSSWTSPRQKSHEPKVKRYSDVVHNVQHYHPKRPSVKHFQPDARGESNRIATYVKPVKGETLTGDKSPDRKPEKDEYHWSDKTSKTFNKKLHSGELRKEHEKYGSL